MRYDHMKQLYPQIDDLFQRMADIIHAGGAPDMAMRRVDQKIRKEIRPEHRQAVADKLRLFAAAIAPEEAAAGQGASQIKLGEKVPANA